MPNIKSAKKRVQVAERNRERNVAVRSAVRTAIKKVLLATKAKTATAEIAQAVQNAYSVIDRAVLKGILHKNTAARCKSRLTKAAQSV